MGDPLKDWQRRLFLFGQEWLGAGMLLWLRHEHDPLLAKAAVGYVISMCVAWWMYMDMWRRLRAWRTARQFGERIVASSAGRGVSTTRDTQRDDCPPTLRSRR
jgi:hypothetical protein